MATPDQWIKLAQIVNELRGDRPKREIVKNPNTLRQMEAGRSVLPATLRYMERQLGLPTGALDHALETGNLPPAHREEVRYAFEDARGVFDGIAGLNDEEWQIISDLLRRGHERLERQRQRDGPTSP